MAGKSGGGKFEGCKAGARRIRLTGAVGLVESEGSSEGGLVGGSVVGRLAEITEGLGVFLTKGGEVAESFLPNREDVLDSFVEPLFGFDVVFPDLFFLPVLFFLGGGGRLTG